MKKNFTKVIAMFIMFSLLSGCSGKQTQKVDEKALHYEADYATLKNSMASSSFMADIKGGALLFPVYENSEGTHKYTVFYDGKNTNIMDSNPESGCDFDNVDSCSRISDEMRSNYTVYGDKLYYVVEAFNKKDQLTETIIRSNFDGTEEEQLLSVTKSDDGEDVSFAFTIHKNILYYADSNKVHAYDLSDNEDEICFELEPDTNIVNMFFEDDSVYITTEIYKDKQEVIKNAILKGSLTDYSMKLWQKEKNVYYANSQFLIEVGNGEKEGVFYYDVASNKKKKLLDTYSFSAFVNDDYIVLCDIDMKNLYLFNRKGELLDKTALEHMEGLPQGIIHHSFYFANGNKFYRYPIKEDKFQKYVQIELT
ncbi:hypothetical protein MKC84_15530 [[Clostridium] innocuum]|nr:hypothetical protein [[Clostridium] innocuum]